MHVQPRRWPHGASMHAGRKWSTPGGTPVLSRPHPNTEQQYQPSTPQVTNYLTFYINMQPTNQQQLIRPIQTTRNKLS